jgi:hypothetical protein
VIDYGSNSAGESLDSAADLIVAVEFSALRFEVIAAGGELGAAVLDIAGAALNLGKGEQAGLVEVGDTAAFIVDRGDLAVEPGQLSREELVVRGWGAGGDGLFASEQGVRVQQGGADPAEDVVVKRLGADVAFRAAPVGADGAGRVVIAAVVVTVPAAVPATHPVGIGADTANTLLDRTFQQPLAGLGAFHRRGHGGVW